MKRFIDKDFNNLFNIALEIEKIENINLFQDESNYTIEDIKDLIKIEIRHHKSYINEVSNFLEKHQTRFSRKCKMELDKVKILYNSIIQIINMEVDLLLILSTSIRIYIGYLNKTRELYKNALIETLERDLEKLKNKDKIINISIENLKRTALEKDLLKKIIYDNEKLKLIYIIKDGSEVQAGFLTDNLNHIDIEDKTDIIKTLEKSIKSI